MEKLACQETFGVSCDWWWIQLVNDVDVQISKIDIWVADFIKKKCPWEIQEKRVFFIRLLWLATKYNLWGFLLSKNTHVLLSKRVTMFTNVCLKTNVGEGWLAFFFFQSVKQGAVRKLFYKFIAKFSEK